MGRVRLLTQGVALGYVVLPLRGVTLASFDHPPPTDNNVLFFSERCGFCSSDYLLAALFSRRDMAEVEVFVREVEVGRGEARRNGRCLG